jgi:hypothetical protein
MDDRLQRRLRDADPLAAAEGQLPDPARLDAIKEHLMQTDAQDTRPRASRPRGLGPRAIGISALAASGLAAVLVVATLVQPAGSALAWDPSPTAATPAQEAAARNACVVPDLPAGDQGAPGLVTHLGGPDAPPSTGAAPQVQLRSELPPLVYLELHGTGAVAVFADEDTTAYCLLVKRGDGFELASLLLPAANGVVGTGGPSQTSVGGGSGASTGPTMSRVMAAGEGDFQVAAMTTDYGDTQVGIIAGTTPANAATIAVAGGSADGAAASVSDGRFALWAPTALDASTTVIALDAAGNEIGRVQLAPHPDGAAPVVVDSKGLPGAATSAP